MTKREEAFLLHGIAQYDLARAIKLIEEWGADPKVVAETFYDVKQLKGARRPDELRCKDRQVGK